MEKHITQKNELIPTVGVKTNREYFPYKAITTLMLPLLTITFSLSMIDLSPGKLLLFYVFFFLLLMLYGALVFVSAASLDDQYFTIKQTIFHGTKRIQLKDIVDIKYDGGYLYITYTHDIQRVNDKFNLSFLFYEDTRKWLIYDLNKTLNKNDIPAIYKRVGTSIETTIYKKYFAYKFATSQTLFTGMCVFFSFYNFWSLIIGEPNPSKVLLYASLTLLFITVIFMLVQLTHFLTPRATLDDECFSIKGTALRHTKRIQLKDITAIRYDNWGDDLYITYTQNAQQVSDKFNLSRLFYEDTRRWLIHDLSEALKNYGITLRYGK